MSLNELARSTYRGDRAASTVNLWTGSQSTDDFLDSYSRIDSIARTQASVILEAETQAATNRNRQARQLVVQDQILDLQEQADALVEEMDARQQVAEDRREDLLALEADEVAQAAALEDQKSEFEASIATIESEQESTQQRIAEIDEENRIRAEEAAQQAAARAAAEERAQAEAAARQNVAPVPSVQPSRAPAPAPAPTARTLFIPPVPAPVYVTSPFGMRWYPITGGYYMHNGVDLRSICGATQVATADGVVQSVRPAAGNGTHGNQVFINHGIINGNSYVTVYNHLSGFAVTPGQAVSQGQAIGYTGMTGAVTGCHVHFEIWQNGSVIDPMTQPGFTRSN